MLKLIRYFMRVWRVIFKKFAEFELDVALFNLDGAHLPVPSDSGQLTVAQQL